MTTTVDTATCHVEPGDLVGFRHSVTAALLRTDTYGIAPFPVARGTVGRAVAVRPFAAGWQVDVAIGGCVVFIGAQHLASLPS